VRQDDGFVERLVDALQPVRSGFVASCVYTLMRTGLARSLLDRPAGVAALARQHGMSPRRLEGLLLFLVNEGYVERTGDRYALSEKGEEVLEFEPWYTLLVGGYWATLAQLPDALGATAPYAGRDGAEVGRGSCGISDYDAIPLVLSLLRRVPGAPARLIDIGCGDGSFLLALLRELPDAHGICVDPCAESVEAARTAATKAGMAGRVEFVTATATGFAGDTARFPGRPGDCYLASFALQEVLEQDGEAVLVDTLTALFERSPAAHMVVVEVEDHAARREAMRDGMALAYYNPYFLLHRITAQRLEARPYWDEVFRRSGLRRVASGTVDPAVDPTGFEFGYLLAAA
jgi:2-ketoarginine methyltransferase